MKFHTLKTASFLVLAAFAQQAAASGYHFGTQSITAQSTANSSSAEAADASTLFYNPAGLTHLKTHEITGALNVVMPSIRYETISAQYRGGAEVNQGSRSGKITSTAVVVPHIYGAYKLNDNTTLGLGVYTPFASRTEYDQDSVLRYNMNKLGLTTIAVEPTIAFKANDKLSVAAGVVAQYSEAELRKYADWGLRSTSGTADGYAEVKGNDWGFGYHLAALYDLTPRTRIGINYRSKVNHTLKGDAHWKADYRFNPLASFAGTGTDYDYRATTEALGYKADEGANISIITPESLSVHGMHQLNDKVNLFGDVTWTRHSRFDTAVLNFENPKVVGVNLVNGTPVYSNNTTLTPNWRNTIRVSTGASYQYSKALQLRAGLAFDQSPVRTSENRMVTLPDGNRIWFSAGIKYNISDKQTLDVAATHIHINNTTVNAATSTGNDVDSKGAIHAKFKNYANIFGVQYSYKF